MAKKFYKDIKNNSYSFFSTYKLIILDYTLIGEFYEEEI